MTITRLPESVQTLYAELLDQVRLADVESAVSGSFVSKVIRDRTYWYRQTSEGTRKRQIYLGAETPELLESMRRATERRAASAADERRRRDLISMLAAGGVARESAAVVTVLRVLADSAVFRAGGVLVGTQALTSIANMLGVRFEAASLRTADIDVAHKISIPLGMPDDAHVDFLQRLRAEEPLFFAVPGIDSREASTSFKVRGRDLRVDFLTPAPRRKRHEAPVYLPYLRVAADPLPNLDYLLEDTVDAAIVGGSGIHVNVPSPARFALHKIWVAHERPPSEHTKRTKDLRQAEQILEVLVEDRPDDIARATEALARRSTMARVVRTGLHSIEPNLHERLRKIHP